MRVYFDFDNLEAKSSSVRPARPISAAGVLIYCIREGSRYALLTSYDDPQWPDLYDFGGRVDGTDRSVRDTVLRELREESNGVITDVSFDTLLYNKEAMYLCVLHQVPGEMMKQWTSDVFGQRELHDNIKRRVAWHGITGDSCLNARIKSITSFLA